MRGIIHALRQRDVRRLLAAGLISTTGDWILRVGLVYRVYVLTGSTVVSAFLLLASFVPQVLLGSFAGVFVDRWDRKRTMAISNLLLAAGLLPLLAVSTASRVWIVYAVLAFEGSVQQFFAPAEQAMLPCLVDDEHLVTTNALNGQTRDLSRLLGGAIGGVVVVAGGIVALTLIDVASFLVSAYLIARITVAAVGADAAETDVARVPAALFAEWRDGLRVSTHHRVLRIIGIFLLVTSLGEGIMGTLFAPFVRTVLHGSGQEYGVIVSIQAVGGIAGGLVAAGLGDRVRASRLFGWGAVCFGAIDLAMFLYPLVFVSVWPAAVCMLVVGMPGALTLAGAMTLLQRNAADSHRGRVFGALGAVEGVAVVLGTLAAGFLAEAIGIIPVLAAQGGGYLLAGIYVVVALRHEDPVPASETDALTDSLPPGGRSQLLAADETVNAGPQQLGAAIGVPHGCDDGLGPALVAKRIAEQETALTLDVSGRSALPRA
jgi:Na+/melibiose symporter-like transporter